MNEPAGAIRLYILAKDGNRPHALVPAFHEDATLRMHLRTDAIAFPAESAGRDAIAETFVRRFNQDYENISTFCIGSPPRADAEAFSCAWFVAMSRKADGAVRFGCGTYDWTFSPGDGRIREMAIAIDAMETLPAVALAPVMAWVSALPYPWCTTRELEASRPPEMTGIDTVLACLRDGLIAVRPAGFRTPAAPRRLGLRERSRPRLR